MLSCKTCVNLLFTLACYVFQEALGIFHETHVTAAKTKCSPSPQPVPALLSVWRLPKSGQNEKSNVNSRLLPLHVAQRLNFSEQNQITLCENSHLGPRVMA